MKRGKTTNRHKDPVCGMEDSYTTAVEEFFYHGKAYYFCSTACREAFEEQPDRYLPHHRQHGQRTE
jgi:YHS domain-containing protein